MTDSQAITITIPSPRIQILVRDVDCNVDGVPKVDIRFEPHHAWTPLLMHEGAMVEVEDQ